MTYDAWSSEGRSLPRVEELPAAEHGYERESVQHAFDAFYRHIAQLDSTLKTLEAVEVFQRQAGELRSELRSLRSAGWTQQPWTSSYSFGQEPRRAIVPPALPRVATEVAFLIAVAVIVGVGHFSATLIVIVMAAAWAIVGAVEWFASRERLPGPVTATAPAVVEEVVAAPESPAPSAVAYGWAAEPEAEPEPEPVAAAEPELEPESELEPEPEPEALPEPEPIPAAADPENGRRRWFRRRRDEAEPEPEREFAEIPSHVRVLERPGDEEADAEPLDGRRRFRRR